MALNSTKVENKKEKKLFMEIFSFKFFILFMLSCRGGKEKIIGKYNFAVGIFLSTTQWEEIILHWVVILIRNPTTNNRHTIARY